MAAATTNSNSTSNKLSPQERERCENLLRPFNNFISSSFSAFRAYRVPVQTLRLYGSSTPFVLGACDEPKHDIDLYFDGGVTDSNQWKDTQQKVIQLSLANFNAQPEITRHSTAKQFVHLPLASDGHNLCPDIIYTCQNPNEDKDPSWTCSWDAGEILFNAHDMRVEHTEFRSVAPHRFNTEQLKQLYNQKQLIVHPYDALLNMNALIRVALYNSRGITTQNKTQEIINNLCRAFVNQNKKADGYKGLYKKLLIFVNDHFPNDKGAVVYLLNLQTYISESNLSDEEKREIYEVLASTIRQHLGFRKRMVDPEKEIDEAIAFLNLCRSFIRVVAQRGDIGYTVLAVGQDEVRCEYYHEYVDLLCEAFSFDRKNWDFEQFYFNCINAKEISKRLIDFWIIRKELDPVCQRKLEYFARRMARRPLEHICGYLQEYIALGGREEQLILPIFEHVDYVSGGSLVKSLRKSLVCLPETLIKSISATVLEKQALVQRQEFFLKIRIKDVKGALAFLNFLLLGNVKNFEQLVKERAIELPKDPSLLPLLEKVIESDPLFYEFLLDHYFSILQLERDEDKICQAYVKYREIYKGAPQVWSFICRKMLNKRDYENLYQFQAVESRREFKTSLLKCCLDAYKASSDNDILRLVLKMGRESNEEVRLAFARVIIEKLSRAEAAHKKDPAVCSLYRDVLALLDPESIVNRPIKDIDAAERFLNYLIKTDNLDQAAISNRLQEIPMEAVLIPVFDKVLSSNPQKFAFLLPVYFRLLIKVEKDNKILDAWSTYRIFLTDQTAIEFYGKIMDAALSEQFNLERINALNGQILAQEIPIAAKGKKPLSAAFNDVLMNCLIDHFRRTKDVRVVNYILVILDLRPGDEQTRFNVLMKLLMIYADSVGKGGITDVMFIGFYQDHFTTKRADEWKQTLEKRETDNLAKIKKSVDRVSEIADQRRIRQLPYFCHQIQNPGQMENFLEKMSQDDFRDDRILGCFDDRFVEMAKLPFHKRYGVVCQTIADHLVAVMQQKAQAGININPWKEVVSTVLYYRIRNYFLQGITASAHEKIQLVKDFELCLIKYRDSLVLDAYGNIFECIVCLMMLKHEHLSSDFSLIYENLSQIEEGRPDYLQKMHEVLLNNLTDIFYKYGFSYVKVNLLSFLLYKKRKPGKFEFDLAFKFIMYVYKKETNNDLNRIQEGVSLCDLVRWNDEIFARGSEEWRAALSAGDAAIFQVISELTQKVQQIHKQLDANKGEPLEKAIDGMSFDDLFIAGAYYKDKNQLNKSYKVFTIIFNAALTSQDKAMTVKAAIRIGYLLSPPDSPILNLQAAKKYLLLAFQKEKCNKHVCSLLIDTFSQMNDHPALLDIYHQYSVNQGPTLPWNNYTQLASACQINPDTIQQISGFYFQVQAIKGIKREEQTIQLNTVYAQLLKDLKIIHGIIQGRHAIPKTVKGLISEIWKGIPAKFEEEMDVQNPIRQLRDWIVQNFIKSEEKNAVG